MSDLLLPPELLIPIGLALVGCVILTIWTIFYWKNVLPQQRWLFIFINVNLYFTVAMMYVLFKIFVV